MRRVVPSVIAYLRYYFHVLRVLLFSDSNHSRNGTLPLVLFMLFSLKYLMIGLFRPNPSISESLRRENFLPSRPFRCMWLMSLSSTRMYRKKVAISSAVKLWRQPSFGIVMSSSGIESTGAERHIDNLQLCPLRCSC